LSTQKEHCENPWNPKCKTENIKLYIQIEGKNLPICSECWEKISDTDLEWVKKDEEPSTPVPVQKQEETDPNKTYMALWWIRGDGKVKHGSDVFNVKSSGEGVTKESIENGLNSLKTDPSLIDGIFFMKNFVKEYKKKTKVTSCGLRSLKKKVN